MTQTSKIISCIQIALLALAVTFGALLYTAPDDVLRIFHRSFGIGAGITGVIMLAMNWRVGGLAPKITGGLAVIATFAAGLAGLSLRTTDSYELMFNVMRSMGVVALALAIITFALMHRAAKNNSLSKSK